MEQYVLPKSTIKYIFASIIDMFKGDKSDEACLPWENLKSD